MDDFKSGLVGKPIKENQIASGMHLCYMNAKALLSESKLLKENGHHARALSLVILALEELGKILFIMGALDIENENNTGWKKYWKSLNSHKVKLGVWSHYGKLLASFEGKGYKSVFPAGIASFVDKIKQFGFYVNFFKDDFVYPEDFAKDNSEWLEYLVELANERIASFSSMHGSLKGSKRVVAVSKDFKKTMEKKMTVEELSKVIIERYSKQMKTENS